MPNTRARLSAPTGAATAIVAAPARPDAMVRPDRDGMAIARRAIVVARLGLRVERRALKVTAAGLLAARDRIFAGMTCASVVRPLHHCRR